MSFKVHSQYRFISLLADALQDERKLYKIAESLFEGCDGVNIKEEIYPLLISNGNWMPLHFIRSEATKRLSENNLWRYGPKLSRQNFKIFYENSIRSIGNIPQKCFEFGCGSFTPLSIMALFYLHGSEECLAVDVEPCNLAEASNALLDLLAVCRERPAEWCQPGASQSEFMERITHFDTVALADGDLLGGIARTGLRYIVGDLDAWNSQASQFDYIFSNSVVEHLADTEGTFKALYNATAPGGFNFHRIDLNDHNIYPTKNNDLAWEFLTVPENKLCNRLRYSQIKSIVEDYGFDVVRADIAERQPPANLRERLHPKFQGLDDKDLAAVHVSLLLHRPATT